ncbi:obscurin-like protein 1 isoform X2 [Ambystoma mexicanum]|uniref:obscurin-like protein 1 isoform X2 n=1 Tax=Ambystoma mexicanum TaxID=8296 RepID=UPI0037E8D05F
MTTLAVCHPYQRAAMDTFGGAPRFLSYPRTFTAKSGETATLKCQIAGDPRPSVLWEKDKCPIHPAGRYRMLEDGTAYHLIISGVTTEDSGQYICKARNGIGETYAAAALNVEGGEEDLEMATDKKPCFLIKPVSLKVTKGDNVAFSCKVWGQPSPTLHWEKDGKKLSDIFESAHFAVGSELEGWHYLKIHSARVPDEGVYVCRACNSFGESLAAAMLLVDRGTQKDGSYPGFPKNSFPLGSEPRTERRQRGRHRHWLDSEPESRTLQQNGELPHPCPKAKAFAVSEGKHAKFRCYVTGKPKPEIIWRKDGRVLAAGRRHLVYEDREGYFILKVLYCKQQDAGLYVCSASNTAGQTLSAVQLHVREPRVKFISQLEDLEVGERTEAVLECQVPSDSMPTAWYLEDQKLQPSMKYLMEEQGTMRRLTIRDTRTDDDGIYLCEMKGGGRSIAELAVIGPIVKRLPRKVDVLEGENAAFCVETEAVTDEVRWSKDGQDLEENHRTVLKSFGRTHILVMVNVAAEDAGMVTFSMRDSDTSSHLRVKSARNSAPSAPVTPQMNKEKTNTALLTWGPGLDQRHLPGTFILERQELGSESWVQCFSTDSASSVEIVGDSVPREANYRFRICAINKYGRSAHVEFPGSVHLVPLAQVQTPLRDLVVKEGEDAEFSLELSTSVTGRWFLNGMQLGEDEEQQGGRCSLRHRRTLHTLLIRRVRREESGAEITFVAYGVRDSAILSVGVPQVSIARMPEEHCKKTLVSGQPVVLDCEVSSPDAHVRWFKDGQELVAQDAICIQADGRMRKLVISSAHPSDTGTYTCDAVSDQLSFTVNVSAPQVSITRIPEEHCKKTLASGQPVVLECEVSSADADVRWFKDGQQLVAGDPIYIQEDGRTRKLVISSTCCSDSGTYTCDAADDKLSFTVNVTEPPVKIVNTTDDDPHTYLASERVVLSCQLSRENAQVRWYKDGVELEESEGIQLEADGVHRRLVIASAGPQDSGEFVCDAGDDSAFYEVKVTDPPVKIVNTSDDTTHTYLSSERVVLSCQLSRESAPVCWYKDGVELEETDGMRLEVDGVYRRLVIASARLQDSGEFVCDAGDDSVFYQVKVTEPPVKIVNTSDNVSHEYLASERVVLSCQLSRENAQVRWYKDGVELEESEGVQLEVDGVHRRLVIASARPQDSGEFVCDAEDDSVFFEVKVAEPPVKIVKTNDSTKHMYLTTERVVLSCQLSRESASVHWYKDGLEIQECGDMLLEVDGVHRRLVIASSCPQDSGEFMCDAGDDSVYYDVKVTDPPVKITYPTSRSTELGFLTLEHVELRCELSRANAEVRWFKDGLEVDESENLRLKADGLRRILILLHASLEDSGEYICDAGDDSVSFDVVVTEPAVKILYPCKDPPTLKVFAGEPFTLVCELSRANAHVRWRRDGQDIKEDGNVVLSYDGAQRKLATQSAALEHTGKYVCDATDDFRLFVVQVSEPPVQFVNKEATKTPVEIVEGETITLTAQVSRETAVVHWLKNWCDVISGDRVSIRSEGTSRVLTIHRAELHDCGIFTCEAQDDDMHFAVKVKDGPVMFMNKKDTPEDVLGLEGASAVLSAVVSKIPAVVTWTRHRQTIEAGDKYEMGRESRVHILTVKNLCKEDAGLYICHTKDHEMQFDVRVKGLPVTFVRGLSDTQVTRGGSVVFWCELCKVKGDVMWLKDGQPLEPSRRRLMKTDGRERSLTLLHVEASDAGEYSCESKDDRTLAMLTVEIPREVEIISELRSVTVLEGDDATFKCVVSPEDVAVTWQLDGVPLPSNNRIEVTRNGLCHSLTIRQCRISDATIVSLDAEGLLAKARLNVQEAQVLFLKKLQNVSVEEMEDVTLEVEVSTDTAEVQWMKHGVVIQPGPKYTLEESGRRHTLTIHGVRFSDCGSYRCESLHDKTQAKLSVEARNVVLRKPLVDVDTVEREAATFQLELSHPNVEGIWTKDGLRLKPCNVYRISASGCVHSLTLSDLTLEDSGSIIFTTDNVRSSARLRVKEPPITIVKEPQDLGVPETASASMECELSRAMGDVKWYKDGKEIKPSPNCRIYSMGRRRFLQFNQCSLDDAGTYTCDAGECKASARLQVFEREVNIVQGLEDLDISENDNAVFMCEVSHKDVPGEWFQNGERIRTTNTVKIRQEGAKHFLLICDVKAEDAGEIMFLAKKAVSTANLNVKELPVRIVKPLRDKTAMARHRVILECKVSNPRALVQWFWGDEEIFPSEKYQLCSEDCYRKLIIHDVDTQDEATYTCRSSNDQTSARLLVEDL